MQQLQDIDPVRAAPAAQVAADQPLIARFKRLRSSLIINAHMTVLISPGHEPLKCPFRGLRSFCIFEKSGKTETTVEPLACRRSVSFLLPSQAAPNLTASRHNIVVI